MAPGMFHGGSLDSTDGEIVDNRGEGILSEGDEKKPKLNGTADTNDNGTCGVVKDDSSSTLSDDDDHGTASSNDGNDNSIERAVRRPNKQNANDSEDLAEQKEVATRPQESMQPGILGEGSFVSTHKEIVDNLHVERSSKEDEEKPKVGAQGSVQPGMFGGGSSDSTDEEIMCNLQEGIRSKEDEKEPKLNGTANTDDHGTRGVVKDNSSASSSSSDSDSSNYGNDNSTERVVRPPNKHNTNDSEDPAEQKEVPVCPLSPCPLRILFLRRQLTPCLLMILFLRQPQSPCPWGTQYQRPRESLFPVRILFPRPRESLFPLSTLFFFQMRQESLFPWKTLSRWIMSLLSALQRAQPMVFAKDERMVLLTLLQWTSFLFLLQSSAAIVTVTCFALGF
jgi:hypothetical protein